MSSASEKKILPLNKPVAISKPALELEFRYFYKRAKMCESCRHPAEQDSVPLGKVTPVIGGGWSNKTADEESKPIRFITQAAVPPASSRNGSKRRSELNDMSVSL